MSTAKKTKQRTEAPRLGRDDWLDAAYLAVVEGGFDQVRVLTLADTLGVTRGSFYWHFSDHAELLQALLQRWQKREIDADLWRFGVDFNFSGDKQQWAWRGRDRRYAGLAYPALRGANQLVNASGVLAALAALHENLPVTAQAVRNGLSTVELPGRFQIVPGQPTLVLDVAHNPHSVAALAANLDAMGFFPTTHAVFGAMADKDLAVMFERVNPIIDRWYFTDLPTARAQTGAVLEAQWRGLNTRKDTQAQAFADPVLALRAAVAAADPADRIVVFGSFYTVGGVLKDGVPRLDAKHLNP